MSLNLNVINDLRDKRAEHVAKSAEMSAEARKFEQFAREFDAAIADLDKAIAALEPQTVEPALEWVEPATADEPVVALPSMDDIIDPDLTGGLQTEEHLDRLHAGTLPAIPEGFTPWRGGECPFPLGTDLQILSRGCGEWPVQIKEDAPLLWVHEGHDLDIIAYRIIEAPADAERVEIVSDYATMTNDIDSARGYPAQISAGEGPAPQIPPELAGQTLGAEAAYAPVNDEPTGDALMWAFGIGAEADAKAKAAEPAPEAKRPFWMFPKKELA